ncbi:hypothetical protein G6L13_09590 [Agrobacterium tumefaciens]|uniref:hypothetical protein n=1 Tax=Agrobacterium tumefaciens TaxID=358 RepID=UPI000A9089B7|nr:hypothetical protein [Agrobacterium tumefaciens]NTA80737.1 hypothetical protein [Agrobacterium tumefaciens]
MPVKIANNAVSTLAASITAAATSISIQSADAGKFPVLAAGDWHPATIIDVSGNMEIVRVTARASNVLTVQRAQEATTAKAFAAGSRIDVRLTAAVISSLPKSKSDIGLSEVDNTSDADKPISTAQQNALDGLEDAIDGINSNLGKWVRVDAVQALTAAQKGQAVANIGGGILSGFRNKIINPSFDIWQRGAGPFTTGYCADRWNIVFGTGASISVSRANFVPSDSVPFVDKYCLNWTRTVAGSASSFLGQKIEGVRTLAGKKVTLTLWARATVATVIQPYLQQNFGSGGSPSGIVWNGATSNPQTLVFAGGGVLQRFDFTFDLPKITDKTIGTNNDDILWLLFEWKASDPNATITMSRISVVDGDARAEADPIAARSIAEENDLCDRYYQLHEGTFFAFAGSGTASVRRYQLPFRSTMRGIPNITWNSGAAFSLDERTTHMVRWFTDPGNNASELALGTVRIDAEL